MVTKIRLLDVTAIALLFCAGIGPVLAEDAGSLAGDVVVASIASTDTETAADATNFRALDEDVQSLKKEVLDLNRDLFLLEEELLFPANSQVAFFISMDVGEYFALDSVNLKIDGKEVTNYLYTERESGALVRGGVHRLHMESLRVGEHELIAIFTGKGPHARDYRRGATLSFDKGIGAKYMELQITDKLQKQQPEFVIQEWE